MTKYKILDKGPISYPSDPDIIKRILAGEKIPDAERKLVEVSPGEIADNIPEVSVPYLLENGHIELLVEKPAKDNK